MAKKILRNGLVATICLVATSTSLNAENRQSAIVVWDGETELYSFFVSDTPVLKVRNGYAVIKSDGTWESEVNLEKVTYECYYRIPMSESSHYKLTLEERDYTGVFGSGNATSIKDAPRAETARPTFSLHDGILQVAGLVEGEQVTVASIDGKVINQSEANSSGQVSVSLHGQVGLIVVKAGNVSFKIMLK